MRLISENTKDANFEDSNSMKFAWLDPSSISIGALNELTDDLLAPFLANSHFESVDLVAGLDAAGFPYAGALANKLNCGFLSIRKENKLPTCTLKAEYVNYTRKKQAMEVRSNFDLTVMDKNAMPFGGKDSRMGQISVPLAQLRKGEPTVGWYKLADPQGKADGPFTGEIELSLQLA